MLTVPSRTIYIILHMSHIVHMLSTSLCVIDTSVKRLPFLRGLRTTVSFRHLSDALYILK